MFLRYVHNFRAIAIVIIVAGHAIEALGWDANPRTVDFLRDLIDSGTVLFVFIAGYLFEHLSGKFTYGGYLHKKLTHVIIPYLLVSLPAVLYTVFLTRPDLALPDRLGGTSIGYQIAWMLLTGGGTFNYQMWFVPMIALYYLAAPLFMQFVKRPQLYLVIVLLVPFVMLAHRPPEVDKFAIALYFLPPYLIGMWASHARERLNPLLDRWWPWLLGLFGAAVLTRFLFSEWHGTEYASRLFSDEFGLFDWMLPQKLLLCFALLGVLRRLDGVIGDRLRFLGDLSFTIYFAHCYVLFAFQVVSLHVFNTTPQLTVPLWLTLTVGTLAVTAGGAALTKRLLGRRSRYLIGS